MTNAELEKLEALCAVFDSPWSAIAACQYMGEDEESFRALAERFPDGTHRRIALAYESLLDPMPVWSIGEDPFEIVPLAADQIAEREQQFVNGLAGYPGMSAASWLEFDLLHDRQHESEP